MKDYNKSATHQSLKNKKGKSYNVNLSWKVFAYFIVFSSLVVFFFWLFQIALLNQFYSTSKKKAMDNILEDLALIVSEADSFERIAIENSYANKIKLLAQKNEIEITVYFFNNQFNDPLIIYPNNFLIDRNDAWIDQIYYKWKMTGQLSTDYERKNTIATSVTYVRARPVYTDSGQVGLGVVESRLFPVESIQNVLMIQFRFILMIIIVLSLLFATITSYYIGLPIINLNRSAKLLALGKYDIDFKGVGYREIEELSSTLNFAAAQLGKLDRYQKELIANVSHDLRTPLTLIAGYSEMMRDFPEEATSENLQIVIDETKRLTRLVNDILCLTKMESGNEELNAQVFNLTEVIRVIIDRQKRLTKNLEFTFEFIDNQVDLYIEGDIEQIKQVIYNFIGNALNYSGDSKEIVIKQTIVDQYVMISVIDHGIGIEPDRIDDIWQRYYKIDTEHKRDHSASGLGLTIVRSILELHQFEYGVKSQIGVGSEFWFKAPIFKKEIKIGKE